MPFADAGCSAWHEIPSPSESSPCLFDSGLARLGCCGLSESKSLTASYFMPLGEDDSRERMGLLRGLSGLCDVAQEVQYSGCMPVIAATGKETLAVQTLANLPQAQTMCPKFGRAQR